MVPVPRYVRFTYVHNGASQCGQSRYVYCVLGPQYEYVYHLTSTGGEVCKSRLLLIDAYQLTFTFLVHVEEVMADVAFAVASVAVSCFLPAPRAGADGAGTSGWGLVESNSPSPMSATTDVNVATNSSALGRYSAAQEGSTLAYDAPSGVRNSAEAPLRISLLLSLLLFSLGVLEAVPSSWLMFLSNHAQSRHATIVPDKSATEMRGRIAMSSAYRFLLWADCIFIAVIVPAALGTTLIVRFIPRVSKEDGGHPRRHMNDSSRLGGGIIRSSHGIIRALCVAQSFVRFIASILLIVCGFMVTQVKRFIGCGRHHQRGLPLVKSVQSMGQMKSDTTTNEPIISSSTSGNGKVATQYSKRGLILGCFVGLLCSYFSLRAIGRFVTEVDIEMENTIALKNVVSQICALGVLISSVLGAFGSVSMPYTSLMGFFLPQISDQSIKSLQKELQNVSQSLATLQSMRSLTPMGPSGSGLASPAKNGASASRGRGMSFFRKRCSSLARGHSPRGIYVDEHQAAATRDEIEYLQNLRADIKDELFEMGLLQIQARRSRTPLGRITGFFGVIFSIVLLVRVGIAMLVALGPGNRAGDNNERSDPITMGLSFLLGFSMIDEVEYDSLQQLASLFLAAFLSVSQVNMFLRTLSTLNRRMGCLWRRSCQSDFVVRDQRDRPFHNASPTSWLLAGIMGSFFLSCLALMKMNMPRNYRREFSSALKGFDDFSFDARITNAVFTSFSILTATILAILFGIRKKTSNLHLLSSQIHGTNAHLEV